MAKWLMKHQVEEFRAKVVYHREVEHMTFTEIAELYQRDHTTILYHYKQYKKAHGEEIPPPRTYKNDYADAIETIRSMVAQGYTMEDIGMVTGLSTTTIFHLKKDNGIVSPYASRSKNRPKLVSKVQAVGKYDHLILEPINQGKTYEEYCKQYGITAPVEAD